MLRLLGGVMGLWGGLLLLMVGVMGTAERENPMPVALLDVNDRNLEHSLYSYVPSDDQPIVITSKLTDVRVFGVSADGLWAYVYGVPHFEVGWPFAGLYRVRLDGEKYQLLAAGIGPYSAEWSPDHQWLVYFETLSSNGKTYLIRLNPATGERGLWEGSFSIPLVMSPEGTRLAATIQQASGDADIIVTDLIAERPKNLTSEFADQAYILAWTSGDEWLIFTRYRVADGVPLGVWAMRPDGGDIQPVIPSVNFTGLMQWFGWLEAARLLVLTEADFSIVGWRIGQATPVWMVQGRGAITPDERTLIFQDVTDRRTLWQMPIEGGTPEKIATLPPMDFGLEISPDGQWALLTAYVGGLSERQLLRVNLRDGTTKAIFTQTDAALPDFAWSPDSQWVSVYDGDGGSFWSEGLFIMRADGSERRALEFSPGRPTVTWYAGEPAAPIERGLGGVGVGLIVGAIWVGWGRRQQDSTLKADKA